MNKYFLYPLYSTYGWNPCQFMVLQQKYGNQNCQEVIAEDAQPSMVDKVSELRRMNQVFDLLAVRKDIIDTLEKARKEKSKFF